MRDLIDIVDEGVFTDFASRLKQGRSFKSTTPSVVEPSAEQSPFDIIKPQDAKSILGAVLNGKPLEQWQINLLKQVYNKL